MREFHPLTIRLFLVSSVCGQSYADTMLRLAPLVTRSPSVVQDQNSPPHNYFHWHKVGLPASNRPPSVIQDTVSPAPRPPSSLDLPRGTSAITKVERRFPQKFTDLLRRYKVRFSAFNSPPSAKIRFRRLRSMIKTIWPCWQSYIQQQIVDVASVVPQKIKSLTELCFRLFIGHFR